MPPSLSHRRAFLKTALASGALSALSFPATAPAASEPVAQTRLADLETDVLVVGAGSSGVPAALAAARLGARVVLLEDDAFPGGAPVDMFVAGPCGNPQVGIYKEMLDRLTAGHNFSVHPDGRATWFLPSSYLRVVMEMIREQPKITLLCHARPHAVLLSEGSRNRIEGVTIERAAGVYQTIRAQIVIDATGTAEVAHRAGCPTMYGCESRAQFNEANAPEQPSDFVQECTWMFITHKVRPGARMNLDRLRWMPNESGYGWINKKDAPGVAEFLKRDAGVYLHWGGHIVCKDTRDPVEIAAAQWGAMVDVVELDAPKLMEMGYAMTLAPKLGLRESRRVVGEHIMTLADLTTDKRPEDVIAIGHYGIDAWGDKNAKKVKLPREGYGLPYRSLLVKDMENLMVVGKSVSASHLAQSAVRVQPIVSQMGQAAGTAAALAVAKKTTLRGLPIAALQARLRKDGLLGDIK